MKSNEQHEKYLQEQVRKVNHYVGAALLSSIRNKDLMTLVYINLLADHCKDASRYINKMMHSMH